MNYAIIGAGGYIARAHLSAIENAGGVVKAAFDIQDSVGILDTYFPECLFFTDWEEFVAYVKNIPIENVVICSPTHKHYENMLPFLESGIHKVICEKPVVTDMEQYGNLMLHATDIYPVLQLRYSNYVKIPEGTDHELISRYTVNRGDWYSKSWKADREKSGGINYNIGIHMFDVATCFLGELKHLINYDKSEDSSIGLAQMEKGIFQWYLGMNQMKTSRDFIFNQTPIYLNGRHKHFYVHHEESKTASMDYMEDTMNFMKIL
jgi:UDP-N-acetyl-2-amino-2-deoxyglucuronate dehydrogenase